MFRIRNSTVTKPEVNSTNQLIEDLERVYQVSEKFNPLSKNQTYLQGTNELELTINKVLELKNSQIREQFLRNIELMEFVTQMDYVKDMVDQISYQKTSIAEVASNSEELNRSILDLMLEELAIDTVELRNEVKKITNI